MKSYIFLALIIIAFLVLCALGVHYQHAQCIESGGKWVTGIVAGEYSAFCIPE
jgi:hypothetical protein